MSEEIHNLEDIPAVEIIARYAIELLNVATIHCGLAETNPKTDLDEARKLITATAGLITAAAPDMGDQHARLLREALRQVQLAFREASPFKDAPGQGPGEKFTGPIN